MLDLVLENEDKGNTHTHGVMQQLLLVLVEGGILVVAGTDADAVGQIQCRRHDLGECPVGPVARRTW
jgi:hypothetical protein